MKDEKVTTVLPANPGFEQLEYHHNGGGEDAYVFRSPVVGWKVVDNGAYVVPLAVEATTNPDTEVFVKCPDGRVVWQECQIWDDEAAWLKDVAARAAEEKAGLNFPVDPYRKTRSILIGKSGRSL